MEIQSAINFLVGSLLFSTGIIIVSAMIIAVNNMFSKYWKPVKWQIFEPHDVTVIDHNTIEELKKTLKQKSSEKEPTK